MTATPRAGKLTPEIILCKTSNDDKRCNPVWEVTTTVHPSVRQTAMGQGQKKLASCQPNATCCSYTLASEGGPLNYPSHCTRDCNDPGDEGSVVEMNCSHTAGHNKARMACSSDPRLLAHSSNRDIVAYNADCLRRDKPCGRKLLFHGSLPERLPVGPKESPHQVR